METTTKPQAQSTETIPGEDIFTAEFNDHQEPIAESSPRLLVRMAARVESLASNFGENMANRRTASEVISDVSDTISEKGRAAYESGRQTLGKMGHAATRSLVRVVTAPARAGETLAKGMESGLNKIEARAKGAKQRKMDRIVARKSAKSLKLQEKQDIKVAKEAKKDSKAEAKLAAETKRNQAKAEKEQHKARLKQHRKNMREAKQMERDDARRERAERNREAARQRAEAAAARKAARRAKYQEKFQNAKEYVGERAKQAKLIGRSAIKGAVELGFDIALIGKDASVKVAQSAKNKVTESIDASRVRRAEEAADKAQHLMNKTKGANGKYQVTISERDGDQS